MLPTKCKRRTTDLLKASIGTIEVGYGLAWKWFGAFVQVGDVQVRNAGISCNVRQRCCKKRGGKSDHGCSCGIAYGSGS
jgi:hypothetical protein